MTHEIDDATLEDLYAWIDSIPLSRPKKDIRRDFSDGVLIAELIKHIEPKLVEIHNYVAASSLDQKTRNWNVLDRKVFSKLGFSVTEDVIRNIATSKPFAIELFLLIVRSKLDDYARQKKIRPQPKVTRGRESDKPEADQYLASPKGKGLHPGTSSRGLNNPPPATKNPKSRAVRGILEPDAIQRRVLDEKEQELIAKDETISILRAKVDRLEHLIHLKDVRINDLQSRLETTRPTGINKDTQRREQIDRRYQYPK